MNDNVVTESIAELLEARTCSGALPLKGRLPMHVVRIQGPKAYALLQLLVMELTGLKAMEAKAALDFFPPSGLVKGKVTTGTFMGTRWKEFAKESVEAWNEKRRSKLPQIELERMADAWVVNRTNRARRGLTSMDQSTALIESGERALL